LYATIHSPLATPGTSSIVLVIGSDAPASAEMLLASTQHPVMLQTLPTKLIAVRATERGVACVGVGPAKLGCVVTVTLPT
jgi:hypothetical protein